MSLEEASGGNRECLRIQAPRGLVQIDLREIWAYRELLYFFVWRDVKVRYKQTVLGVAWAVIQPVMMMVVFSIFFGRLAKIPSDGQPYPVFSFVALLPWTYFATSITLSANSLVSNAGLIRKIYFPRLIRPAASVISPLLDFAIAFSVLVLLFAFYGVRPGVAILLLPLFLLLAFITALGVGFWLSAINVRYRDVRHAVPFLVQAWMFASPVVYSSSLLDEPWRTLYGLNPMVGVIEGFRWALLGASPPQPMILASALVAVGILVTGILYFGRVEKAFADVI